MINNYLDYAKRCRKHSAVRLHEHHQNAKGAVDDWGKGFYKGLAINDSFEARRWRRLQKDIEATLKTVSEIYPPFCEEPILNKFGI